MSNLYTEIPTIIDPSATREYLRTMGSIIVGIRVHPEDRIGVQFVPSKVPLLVPWTFRGLAIKVHQFIYFLTSKSVWT